MKCIKRKFPKIVALFFAQFFYAWCPLKGHAYFNKPAAFSEHLLMEARR